MWVIYPRVRDHQQTVLVFCGGGGGIPCVFITVTGGGSDQNGLVGSYTPYMTTKEQIRTKSEQNVREKII